MSNFDLQYFQFGTLVFDLYNKRVTNRANVVRSQMVQLADGLLFDGYLTEQAGRELPASIRIQGAVMKDTPAELQAEIDGIKSWLGKREKLYRRRADGTEQWVYARLMSVPESSEGGQLSHREIELEFAQLSPVWNGADRSATTYLDAGGNSIIITNNGNAPVKNLVLKIDNFSSGKDITSVMVVKLRDDFSVEAGFTITLTIDYPHHLKIDCGTKMLTTTASGAPTDLYNTMVFNTDHSLEEWLVLDPGPNNFFILCTGDSGFVGSAVFTFKDGWQ